MTSVDYFQSLLCLRAWQDGHEDGLNGMAAVCFTLRNRIRRGWFNGDWGQLLSHHRDYSYRIEPYSDDLPDPSKDYSFHLLLQQVDGIFNGQTEDKITVASDSLPPPLSPMYVAPVALFFARLDRITNPWFLENISRNIGQHKLMAQVGSLSFFS